MELKERFRGCADAFDPEKSPKKAPHIPIPRMGALLLCCTGPVQQCSRALVALFGGSRVLAVHLTPLGLAERPVLGAACGRLKGRIVTYGSYVPAAVA